jgi:hypothetical protein
VLVPAGAGSLRLVEPAGSPLPLANPRMTASPVPVVVHILSVARRISGRQHVPPGANRQRIRPAGAAAPPQRQHESLELGLNLRA